MMYGQMTAGLVDLHRHAGDPAGHLRDVRRGAGGSTSAPTTSPGRLVVTARARRHGRRAAARRDDVRRRRSSASRSIRTRIAAAPRDALPRRVAPTTSTRRSRVCARREAGARAAVDRLVGNARRGLPELVQRGVAPDLVTDQTSAHDPLNGYIPPGLTLDEAAALRERDPDELRQKRASRVMARARARRCSSSSAAAATSSTTATTCAPARMEAGVRDAFAYPGLRARLHPPALLRGQGAVPLGRALRRSRRTSRHRSRRARARSRQPRPAPLDRAGAASA